MRKGKHNAPDEIADVGLADDDWLAVVGVGEDTRFRLHVEDDRGKPWFDLASKGRVSAWKPGTGRDQVNTGDGTLPYLGAQATGKSPGRRQC